MKICYRCGERYAGWHGTDCQSCGEDFCVFSHQEISDILNNLIIEELVTQEQVKESGYNVYDSD